MGKIYGDPKTLDLERVRKHLDYDPDTGLFRWKERRSNVKAGAIAGTRLSEKIPYILIRIDNCSVYAHRLAWFYVHGVWPPEYVDHINGNRSDNSLRNLRLASNSQNTCNQILKANNTSGFRGVCWDKEKRKWVAHITKDRKQRKLGYFATPEEAYAAYVAAAKEAFGEFSNSS